MRASARSNRNSILSSSDIGSLMKDHDVRTGDLPLACSEILSFHVNTAASNLLMASSALCSDFKLRKLIISPEELDSAVKTLYSSSPRLAFPDCKKKARKEGVIICKKTASGGKQNLSICLSIYLYIYIPFSYQPKLSYYLVNPDLLHFHLGLLQKITLHLV